MTSMIVKASGDKTLEVKFYTCWISPHIMKLIEIRYIKDNCLQNLTLGERTLSFDAKINREYS